MTDRLTLIARLGARIAALEGSGDDRTLDVLREALGAIVEDSSIIAQAEKRKAKDRRRKGAAPSPALALVAPSPAPADAALNDNGTNGGNEANGATGANGTKGQLTGKKGNVRNPRNVDSSADSVYSVESAESAERLPASDGDPAAHITRALGLEGQKQDQKQELESPDGLSSGVRPPGDDTAADAASSDAPGDDQADDAGPAIPDPLAVTFPRITVRHGGPVPERRGLKTAVDFVIAKYLERHPMRRPGEADRALVARRLATYTARELCEAIDGNADDEWAQRTKKHELSWTLRNNGQIDNYRLKASAVAQGAEVVASSIAQTGWFPS